MKMRYIPVIEREDIHSHEEPKSYIYFKCRKSLIFGMLLFAELTTAVSLWRMMWMRLG